MKRNFKLSSEKLEEKKKKRKLYMKTYRAKESKQARDARLQHMRQHTAEMRATQSEQAREARLQRMRQHTAEKRAIESKQAREARLQKVRQHSAEMRATQSEQARQARLQKVRQHTAEMRATESKQAREARLQKVCQHSAEMRATQSEQARQARLQRMCQYIAKMRATQSEYDRAHCRKRRSTDKELRTHRSPRSEEHREVKTEKEEGEEKEPELENNVKEEELEQADEKDYPNSDGHGCFDPFELAETFAERPSYDNSVDDNDDDEDIPGKEDAVPTLALNRLVDEVRCVVNGCVKDEDATRRLFKMPQHAAQISNWCHNLRLDRTAISGTDSHVCERHFEAQCFNVYKALRPGALPTLHLGHDDLLPNPTNFDEDAFICCVPNCRRSKDADNVLIGLPKGRIMAEKWLQNIHLDPNNDQLASLKICSVHFEASCLKNGRLTYGAMPTLHLGHDQLHNINQIFELSSTNRRLYCNKDGANNDCCYPQCVELQKSYLRVTYELPQKQELREQWLSYMGLEEPLDKQQFSKLCPLHLILLYDHSVDNFSAHAGEELLDADYEASRSSVRIRSVSCAVRGCKTLKPRDGGRLHGFPTRRDLLEMWQHNMQLVFYEQKRYMYKICSKHFEPMCLTETIGCLKPWSIPTLELPERQPGEMPLYQNFTESEWQLMNGLHASASTQIEEPSEALLKLETLCKLEPPPQPTEMEYEGDYSYNSQQTLEVLLEVSHVEQMDPEPNPNYAEQVSPLSAIVPQGRSIAPARNGFKYNSRACSVHGCNVNANNKDSHIRLHKFPTSMVAMQKWMHNTQVTVDIKFAWHFRICSHHFIPDCFQGSCIRPGAMPTLRLGSRRPKHIYGNEFSSQLQPELQSKDESAQAIESAPAMESQQQLQTVNIDLRLPSPAPPRKSSKCCQIEGCSNHLTSENVTLHKFPHSADMCTKWQHNTQVPFDPEYRWRYRICSAHFEPICLDNVRLKHGSVPTLNLGPLAPKKVFENDFICLDKPRSSFELGAMEQFDANDDDQEWEDYSLLETEPHLDEELSSESTFPQRFNQCELNNLIRDLGLSKQASELLTSSLNEKKLLECGTKINVVLKKD